MLSLTLTVKGSIKGWIERELHLSLRRSFVLYTGENERRKNVVKSGGVLKARSRSPFD